MKVKDGYLFPLVFECSAGFRYTAYIDDSIFRFVSNQSGEVWTNDSRFSFEQFKIYVKDGSWKILTPQFDHTSELTEALAKIDTLESALEDAVRELISLREGSNTVVIDVKVGEVKLGQFKPINEMTLGDWEAAKEDKWAFKLNNGREVFVKGIMEEFDSEDFPVELSYVDEGTHAGIVTVDGCFFPDRPAHFNSVKCRIK